MMETFKLLAPLAWRNIWRNPRRTVITLIVVSTGVFSILFFASFIQAWAASSRDRTLQLLTGSAQIHAPGYMDDPTIARLMDEPDPTLSAALSDNEIGGWAPRLVVPAVLQSEYRSMPTTLVAVDPARESRISVLPGMVTEGRYLQGVDDPTIVLGARLVKRLKTRLGKRVIILAQGTDGISAERSFVVSGIFSGASDIETQYAFVGLASAQDMLGARGKLAEIAVLVPDDKQLGATVEALKQAAPTLDIRSWRDLSPMAATIDKTTGVFVYIFLWVMFVLMAIGIVNTQLMAVYERIREFGLLQALGMRPRMILLIVALESTVLVGLGTVLGLVLAVAAVQGLSGGIDMSVFSEAAAAFGFGQVVYPKIHAALFVQLSVIVWILGILVALWPARKAAKSSPVEAMIHVS